jgi:PHD/YefM family antitoxin component YafN of YafNO toxin-antitoxin module
MKFVTVSELRASATRIVSEIEATKEPVAVTKNGKPVVLMQFVTDEAFGLKSLTDAELDERIKALLKADEPRGKGSKQ